LSKKCTLSELTRELCRSDAGGGGGRSPERLTKRAERIEFYVSDPLCQVAPAGRLDEVESKLDRMLQELRTLNTPTAIGYSVRRGNLPRKD